MRIKKVIVPGAFDPIHPGHIELLKEASKLGKVIVILKGDHRLIKKKKKILMCADDRAKILESVKYVDEVIIYDSNLKDHEDFSIVLDYITPDIWALGETKSNCGEPTYLIKLAKKLGVKVLYGVGGKRIHSSSQILKDYIKK